MEKLSREEINARNEYQMAIISHKEKVDNRDEWINQYGAQLADNLRTDETAVYSQAQNRPTYARTKLTHLITYVDNHIP